MLYRTTNMAAGLLLTFITFCRLGHFVKPLAFCGAQMCQTQPSFYCISGTLSSLAVRITSSRMYLLYNRVCTQQQAGNYVHYSKKSTRFGLNKVYCSRLIVPFKKHFILLCMQSLIVLKILAIQEHKMYIIILLCKKCVIIEKIIYFLII